MPHQCTNCDRRFPDGSKEMLSGCPDCGGNKFQFAPSSDDAGDESAAPASSTSSPTESPPAAETEGTESASSAGSQAGTTRQREWPETAQRPAERDDVADRPESATATGSWPDQASAESTTDAMEDDFEWVTGDEDDAQATARSDVVSPDELPARDDPDDAPTDRSADGTAPERPVSAGGGPNPSSTDPPEHGQVVSEPEADKPSIDELREELNQQFESIKILNPGQYELNLMELYDREEHIVSLQEDGRYVINVPESWHDS